MRAWGSDPVGYLQIAPEVMGEDVAIGYPSSLIEGERDCHAYMHALFDNWQATGPA